MYWFTYAILIVLPTLNVIAHWIFAINYFEVAISTSVFIRIDLLESEDIKRKQKTNDWILRVMNIVFYLVIVISAALCFGLEKELRTPVSN